LKAGTIVRKFATKDGKEVILRTPRFEDLDDCLDFINSLVEEEAMILVDTKMTREAETDWLARNLSDLEKDRHVCIFAEVEGRMVGAAEMSPRVGRSKHVANFGIAIKEEFREVGIGQEMMKEIEKHAERLGIEKIFLEVFDINDRARYVYEKMGYHEVGRIPDGVKYRGKYVDSVHMIKSL
jgi:RimJ/RimL family protein N-acetyltransferase